MTSTSSTTAYGGRVFAVVLVAAWVGALAVTSAPAAAPEGRPRGMSGEPHSAAVTVVSTAVRPLSSGQIDTASLIRSHADHGPSRGPAPKD